MRLLNNVARGTSKLKGRNQPDIEVECNFLNVPPDEIEACCCYEYFRESKAMRESGGAALPLFARVKEPLASAGLLFALHLAGFPAPWNLLSAGVRKDLASALRGTSKELHPPFLASEFSPTCFDDVNLVREHLEQWRELAYEQRYSSGDALPVEPGRSYIFGLFRLDRTCNEGEAIEAFKAWRARQCAKIKPSNPQFAGKLNQLAAMRVRHHYPRGEREKILAQVTGKATYKTESGKAGSATDKTDTGLSRDCKEALKFFQTLFPKKQPIHYPRFRKT